jgi:hypothetical protein
MDFAQSLQDPQQVTLEDQEPLASRNTGVLSMEEDLATLRSLHARLETISHSLHAERTQYEQLAENRRFDEAFQAMDAFRSSMGAETGLAPADRSARQAEWDQASVLVDEGDDEDMPPLQPVDNAAALVPKEEPPTRSVSKLYHHRGA